MVGGENAPSLRLGLGAEISASSGTEERHLDLLTTSGPNEVEISCGKAEVGETTIDAQGNSKGTASISECSTSINGKGEALRDPLGQPVTLSATTTIVKHEGVAYLKAEAEGGSFGTLKFDEECTALAESVKLAGTLWLKDANGKLEEEATSHLVAEAATPAGALGGLEFGANAATVDGSATVKLTDEAHKGLKFSGLG